MLGEQPVSPPVHQRVLASRALTLGFPAQMIALIALLAFEEMSG